MADAISGTSPRRHEVVDEDEPATAMDDLRAAQDAVACLREASALAAARRREQQRKILDGQSVDGSFESAEVRSGDEPSAVDDDILSPALELLEVIGFVYEQKQEGPSTSGGGPPIEATELVTALEQQCAKEEAARLSRDGLRKEAEAASIRHASASPTATSSPTAAGGRAARTRARLRVALAASALHASVGPSLAASPMSSSFAASPQGERTLAELTLAETSLDGLPMYESPLHAPGSPIHGRNGARRAVSIWTPDHQGGGGGGGGGGVSSVAAGNGRSGSPMLRCEQRLEQRLRFAAAADPARGNSPSSASKKDAATTSSAAANVVSSGATNRMAGSLHAQVLLQRKLAARQPLSRLKTPLPLPGFYEQRKSHHGDDEGPLLSILSQTVPVVEAMKGATFVPPASRATTPAERRRTRCPYRLAAGSRPATPIGNPAALAAFPHMQAPRSLWTPPPITDIRRDSGGHDVRLSTGGSDVGFQSLGDGDVADDNGIVVTEASLASLRPLPQSAVTVEDRPSNSRRPPSRIASAMVADLATRADLAFEESERRSRSVGLFKKSRTISHSRLQRTTRAGADRPLRSASPFAQPQRFVGPAVPKPKAASNSDKKGTKGPRFKPRVH